MSDFADPDDHLAVLLAQRLPLQPGAETAEGVVAQWTSVRDAIRRLRAREADVLATEVAEAEREADAAAAQASIDALARRADPLGGHGDDELFPRRKPGG